MTSRKKEGLVLTEALMAVAMLLVGTIVVGTIINNALKTMALSKTFLVAQNIATEGVEAVRNIRNTNWLKNPKDKNCWLIINPEQGCTNGVVALEVENAFYVPVKSLGGKWSLDTVDNALDWENNPNTDPLDPYQVELNGEKVDYYRSVKFNDIETVDGDDVSANYTVKVEWKVGKKVYKLERTSVIYNY